MSNVELREAPRVTEFAGTSFRTVSKWAALIVVGVFCLYRLANFTPQPLDSPNSLRPVLFRVFDWWLHLKGTPEQMLARWEQLCSLALCIPPVLAFLNYLWRSESLEVPRRAAQVLFSRWFFFSSIAGCLLLCRFPILLLDELNPDEGEFLFAARQLFHDPNFFRAVDCHTSGPLNIYPLMLPAIFGVSPDFASSRLIGLVAIFLTAFFLYRAFALLVPDEIARLAVLPVPAAFCVFKNTELLHMSSEHIPLLLIAIATYLFAKILCSMDANRKALFLLGFVACAAFFTKMQSMPIIAAISAIAIVYVRVTRKAATVWKPALYVLAGTLPLLLLNAVICCIGGVWHDFWISYVVSNWAYPSLAGSPAIDFKGFLDMLMGPAETRFLVFAAFGLGAVAICFRLRARLSGVDRLRWFSIFSWASLVAGFSVAYLPHRPFIHYLLFVILPLCGLLGWMLVSQYRLALAGRHGRAQGPPAVVFVSIFVVAIMAYQSYVWRLPIAKTFGDMHNELLKHIVPFSRPPEGEFIRSLTSPHDQIRVWGWTVRPYLASAREGEGRDTHMLYCLRHDSLRSYYVGRFVGDMQRRPPAVFIDATGPTSWFFNDPFAFRFEQVPEVAQFVNANYVHFADLYGQRYFLRRDLVKARESLFSIPLQPKACDPGALACLQHAITLPEQLPHVDVPEHALLQAEFVPVEPQVGPATVFNSEAAPNSNHGFRLLHTSGDNYIFLAATGDRWVSSKEFRMPVKQPVWLTIEFNKSVITVTCNGQRDVLHLPRPMANSPGGPLNLNSWLGDGDPFIGKMQFFQIVKLEG